MIQRHLMIQVAYTSDQVRFHSFRRPFEKPLGKIGSAFVLSIRKRHHRFRLMNKNKFSTVSRAIGVVTSLSS